MLILHKLLPLIFSPLGFFLACFFCFFVFRHRWLGILGLIAVLVCALPKTSTALWEELQKQYPPPSFSGIPEADAIVVLSGMLTWIESSGTMVPQWGDATDRYFQGIDLIKGEKAPYIVFTRGKVPGSDLPAEGDILFKRAVEMGVTASKIVLTDVAFNTEGEACQLRKISQNMGFEKITLVTSSFHMPRAREIFERAGFFIVPYATDFRIESTSGWLDWIPSGQALGSTSAAVREILGRAYYKLKHMTFGSSNALRFYETFCSADG